MIITKDTVAEALSEVLHTEWEMSVDSDSDLPIITYRQSNDYDYVTGSTKGHSRISYLIKIWAYTVDEIETYSALVDSKMRSIGFKRDSINETVSDGVICKLMNYTALTYEYF